MAAQRRPDAVCRPASFFAKHFQISACFLQVFPVLCSNRSDRWWFDWVSFVVPPRRLRRRDIGDVYLVTLIVREIKMNTVFDDCKSMTMTSSKGKFLVL
jgi:hypothetical protein